MSKREVTGVHFQQQGSYWSIQPREECPSPESHLETLLALLTARITI